MSFGLFFMFLVIFWYLGRLTRKADQISSELDEIKHKNYHPEDNEW